MLILLLAACLVSQLVIGIGTLCLLDRLIGEVNFISRVIVDWARADLRRERSADNVKTTITS